MKRNSREAEARFSADWREGLPGDWFPGQPVAHIAGMVRERSIIKESKTDQAIYTMCVINHEVPQTEVAKYLGVTLRHVYNRIYKMRKWIALGENPFTIGRPRRTSPL